MREKLVSLFLASSVFLGTVAEAKNQSWQLAQVQSVSSQVEFLNGLWEGTYKCSQGLTKLRLIIKAKSTTEIDAVFWFSAHPSNPNVPSGRFRMKGALEVFTPQDIPNILELKATTWMNRPAGYSTVDLLGEISLSEQRITGSVLSNSSSCSTFSVVKREG